MKYILERIWNIIKSIAMWIWEMPFLDLIVIGGAIGLIRLVVYIDEYYGVSGRENFWARVLVVIGGIFNTVLAIGLFYYMGKRIVGGIKSEDLYLENLFK